MTIRYAVQYKYGRYEICDTLLDHTICYTHVGENAQAIADAMNEQYRRDLVSMKKEIK